MSVTILPIPAVVAVRNPLEVHFATRPTLVTQGAPPKFTIRCHNVPLSFPEPTITLTFGNTVVVLTWSSSPSKLDMEYGGSNTEDIATSIALALAAHYFVGSHYEIALSPFEVICTGIVVGTTYGLTGSSITNNAGPILSIQDYDEYYTPRLVRTGVEPTYLSNYRVVVQLWVEENYGQDDYQLKMEVRLPADATNVAREDFSQALRAYVEPAQPDPNGVSGLLPTQYRRWHLRAGEMYVEPDGTIVLPAGMDTQTGIHAVLGGISEPARVRWTTMEQWSTADGDEPWKFLTTWPNSSELTPKRVRPEQWEHLTLLIAATMPKVGLCADIWYDDNTLVEGVPVDDFDPTGDVVRGQVLLFQVGLPQQDYNAYFPTKTISKYAVYCTDNNGNRITERRYYQVDREHHAPFRQFHYFNTLGGWDTLALMGERMEEVRATMRKAERYVAGDPTSINSVRDSENSLDALDVIYEIGTEHLHQDELEALRDLVASERIIERVGTDHWPVELIENKMKLGDEAEGRTPKSLKYRYAFRRTATTLNQ